MTQSFTVYYKQLIGVDESSPSLGSVQDRMTYGASQDLSPDIPFYCDTANKIKMKTKEGKYWSLYQALVITTASLLSVHLVSVQDVIWATNGLPLPASLPINTCPVLNTYPSLSVHHKNTIP